ncbi:MAG: YihY family inner membrane protein [Burkholderiales bacterium]|nr:YihY family inner membrane protein [Burkholderiales bacterium]
MLQKTPPLIDLARIVAGRLYHDRYLQTASSLTFTTLLSIVPLITVAFTLISAFPALDAVVSGLGEFVLGNLLPESVDIIAIHASQFTENAAKLTAAGIVFLVVTSLMTMATIERAFNDIWRVSRQRSLFQRMLIYWTLLTVGPVLIGASLSLTSWLVGLSLGLVGDIPGAGVALLKTVPIVLTALALALLYLTMPNRRVKLVDALFGGLLAGLVFEAMKQGFAFYITQFPAYTLVYGAFASVPIFLLWIYLSWLVVLFGGVVVATLPEWRARAGRLHVVPGGDFFDALQILKILWQAHHDGRVVDLAALHGSVRTRIERIEAILDAMEGAGWVSRALPAGWVLSRDPKTIGVGDVYRLFVFRAEARMPSRKPDAALESLAQAISARITEGMRMSVEELFRSCEPVLREIPAQSEHQPRPPGGASAVRTG